jgi:hypothetical protein
VVDDAASVWSRPLLVVLFNSVLISLPNPSSLKPGRLCPIFLWIEIPCHTALCRRVTDTWAQTHNPSLFVLKTTPTRSSVWPFVRSSLFFSFLKIVPHTFRIKIEERLIQT